jgi:pilus assembly protein TadC
MKSKTLYLVLCAVGVLLPYAEFIPWVSQHGLNLSLFIRELLSTRIGAFFGMDVIVSAVTLVFFTRIESRRPKIQYQWAVILSLLTVGVSLGLPLFLYLREIELERPALARA